MVRRVAQQVALGRLKGRCLVEFSPCTTPPPLHLTSAVATIVGPLVTLVRVEFPPAPPPPPPALQEPAGPGDVNPDGGGPEGIWRRGTDIRDRTEFAVTAAGRVRMLGAWNARRKQWAWTPVGIDYYRHNRQRFIVNMPLLGLHRQRHGQSPRPGRQRACAAALYLLWPAPKFMYVRSPGDAALPRCRAASNFTAHSLRTESRVSVGRAERRSPRRVGWRADRGHGRWAPAAHCR